MMPLISLFDITSAAVPEPEVLEVPNPNPAATVNPNSIKTLSVKGFSAFFMAT